MPTWNYVAVHAYGRLRPFDDPARTRRHLEHLTDTNERDFATPWRVDDAPDDFIRAHVKGVVGFDMRITRLHGKWKTSQNRNAADRAGVVNGLTECAGPDDLAMADLVAAVGRPEPE